jgi:hypothetical protein
MKIKCLNLSKFTAFEEATFEFVPGVNVLFGENATGKSHVLKILYVVNESIRLTNSTISNGNQREHFKTTEEAVETLLMQVFMPDELGRLVRRAPGRRTARIEVEWDNKNKIGIDISSLGKISTEKEGELAAPAPSVFVPPREVLSIFPGFISEWQKRESNFDRTYYDLCLALDARPLRGPRDDRRAQLLTPFETALGGNVTLKNGKFYVRLHDGDMEAPLVAEGLRKLAALTYLVVNGSLSENAFLFWDEPEANLNPKLAQIVSEVILAFGDWGVQVVLATHDYALGSELSLESEIRHRKKSVFEAAFFGLSKGEDASVRADRASRFVDLPVNPILDALASLHDRELQLEEG